MINYFFYLILFINYLTTILLLVIIKAESEYRFSNQKCGRRIIITISPNVCFGMQLGYHHTNSILIAIVRV